MLRLFLVHAIESEQTDRVHQFFSSYSEQFTCGPDAQEWAGWFALPFLQKPQRDPRFQVKNAVKNWEPLILSANVQNADTLSWWYYLLVDGRAANRKLRLDLRYTSSITAGLLHKALEAAGGGVIQEPHG